MAIGDQTMLKDYKKHVDERAKLKLEINNKTGSKIKEIKEYTEY